MIYRVDVLLFDKFETLDVFGPVEILGKLPDIFKLNFISANGGIVESSQNVRVDTNLYTSSGVSAGIDMALGFIADLIGKEIALEISQSIEYLWNENSEYDPFSKIYD